MVNPNICPKCEGTAVTIGHYPGEIDPCKACVGSGLSVEVRAGLASVDGAIGSLADQIAEAQGRVRLLMAELQHLSCQCPATAKHLAKVELMLADLLALFLRGTG